MATVKVVVHQFTMGDVDDPEVYAAQPIYEWQQTEAGKWIMENAIDIYWDRHWNISQMYQQYRIVAELTETDLTWYGLKYDYPERR
jgi:hypothetical protein